MGASDSSSAATPVTATSLPRNVRAIALVSLLTDVSSEMIYPLLPIFLSAVLGASAGFIGVIEGTAESTAALLKLASGWWSDRVRQRKPLVVLGYGIASFVRPLVAIAGSATHVLLIRMTDRVGKGIRTTPRDALIADSVTADMRGRAFGFRAAADNAGAMLGPLVAFAVMTWGHAGIRTIFWLAAIPAALAMVVLVGVVRDVPRRSAPGAPARTALIASVVPVTGDDPVSSLPHGFWWYLGVVLLFTLGNSTDAFLLLRAQQLGVPTVLAPVLWALLSGVKALTSTHGGALSDRLGRRPMIVAGWVWYAIVYFAFARADAAWQVWGLFAIYGIFYGMTEGAEKALVVDLVPRARIGTALGWYNLAIGIGALPASVLFGIVWDRAGASAAFVMGAGLAMMAVLGLVVFVDRGSA